MIPVLLTLVASPPSWCKDIATPIAEFRFAYGPLRFSRVDHFECSWADAGPESGQERFRVTIRMQAARLELLSASGTNPVLAGTASKVELVGIVATDQAMVAPYLQIAAGGLHLSLLTDAPITRTVAGGTL